MKDLSALPRKAERGGYIYVITFGNGIVKPGRTADPYSRFVSHRTNGQVFGVTLTDWWLSPLHGAWVENERKLIDIARACGGIPSGAEYFSGLGFAALVDEARQLDFAPVDPTEKPRLSSAASPWLKRQLALYRTRVDAGIVTEDEAVYELAGLVLFAEKDFVHGAIRDRIRQDLTTADVWKPERSQASGGEA